MKSTDSSGTSSVRCGRRLTRTTRQSVLTEGKPQSPSQQNNSSGAAIFSRDGDLSHGSGARRVAVDYQNKTPFYKKYDPGMIPAVKVRIPQYFINTSLQAFNHTAVKFNVGLV